LTSLSQIALERGDLDVALDFAHRAAHRTRELCAVKVIAEKELLEALAREANILDLLGRLDEAMALDAEWRILHPGEDHHAWALVRRAIKHIAAGEDAEAEELLRSCLLDVSHNWSHLFASKAIETALRPHTLLSELLERRGTQEALAEARTLRDDVAQELATYEARRAVALEETRAVAAEAVRQWRGERVMAKGRKKGAKGKGKGKKKGRRGKAKGKKTSSAAAIRGEPAGGQMNGAAAVEGAAAAEAEQQAEVEESHAPEEEEEEEEAAREECAICLQDLQLEDDEDAWGDEGGESEALVVLECGHRFHEICGDMWCAKCADKGWGVTCPRCRAAYVLVRG
jgi:hypothetical protein